MLNGLELHRRQSISQALLMDCRCLIKRLLEKIDGKTEKKFNFYII